MNNNSPPLTFKRFQTIVSRLELPRRPLPTVTQHQMNKCGAKMADNQDQLYSIPSLEELGSPRRRRAGEGLRRRPAHPSALACVQGSGPKVSRQRCGEEESRKPWRGSTNIWIRRYSGRWLTHLGVGRGPLWFTCVSVPLQVWVANLEHSRVSTCSLYASPAGLSPYLRFGCLSCRVLYYNLRELYVKVPVRCTVRR